MSENAQHDGDKAVSNRRPSLIAYQVRDGGFTVQLHSVPLSGRIVLAKPKNNA
jgi:hypothetical protein